MPEPTRAPVPAPAGRRRRRVRSGLAAVAVVASMLAATAPAIAVPRPPLVTDGHPLDGQVQLSPATQATRDDHVTWVLANGGEGTLTFDLAVHEVDATTAGVEIGALADLALGVDRLTLAPGEAARVPLSLPGSGAPRALALVASTTGAEPPTTLSGVVLVDGGGPVAPRVAEVDADDGTFTVRLAADGPTLVDVALRATAWPGWVHTDELVESLYVPAGGRDLEVSLTGAVAGRVTIEVAIGGGTRTRVTETVWWWPPRLVGGVVLGLVLLVGALAAWSVRRRRRRHAVPDHA